MRGSCELVGKGCKHKGNVPKLICPQLFTAHRERYQLCSQAVEKDKRRFTSAVGAQL